MADFIRTYTGVHFKPTDPDPEGIQIEDIAHALSLLCRGNGQVKTFLSIGQHCIRCAREAEARGLSDRLVFACLLHDAGEAYMSDIPRPYKVEMPQYLAWEDALLDMIYEKYLGSTLTEEEKRQVKIIDDDLLYFDLTELLNEPAAGPAPEMKTTFTFDFVPFEVVEKTYLELFEEYKRRL